MCLILLAVGAHHDYPLIVAANRDEAYARPTAGAAFWTDYPQIFAGRDLECGGTWLGFAKNGRFAAITNYRQGHRLAADRSRGELTRDYLGGSADADSYLRAVERRSEQYNGFSLIVGDLHGLSFYSNRGESPHRITPGVHGLSNHLLDEPWPKVLRGIAELTSLLEANESRLVKGLFHVLADRTPAPDHLLPATGVGVERERALSAAFITGETYGTRASTVLLVSADGEAYFCERSYGPGGAAAEVIEQRIALEQRVTGRAEAAARS